MFRRIEMQGIFLLIILLVIVIYQTKKNEHQIISQQKSIGYLVH